MLQILVRLHVHALAAAHRWRATPRWQAGQTTAEYALVLLGAASVALLIALWARSGGRVGELLDALFDSLVRMVRT